MLKPIFIALLSFNMLFSNSTGVLTELNQKAPADNSTGTLEKMIVANGNVAMNLDLNRLNGNRSRSGLGSSVLRFEAERNSFYTVMVFNNELRGPLPGSMGLIPQTSANLPSRLNASYKQLVLETTDFGSQYELVIRDAKTGFTFFNVEGQEYGFEPNSDLLNVRGGRILLSREFANELGRPSEAGMILGEISISANMRTIESTQIFNGEVQSEVLPANPQAGSVPGPDVVVGDVVGLAQFGSSSGSQVGLAVGTTSCNFGTVDLNWFANPDNDHPAIPQNLYRMSGGANNDERFEQIGQSSVKHAFTALTQNICSLGCNGVGGTRLGSGCSDPYSASLNSGPSLGSRAWINPFTGFYPRNDSATPNNSHSGHSHNGTSHRVLTEISDLNTSLNQGATYYAEGQYITPHEYAWCSTHPTECNMFNNVSYRQYSVTGTGSPFSFSPVGSTVRAKPAIDAWTGSTSVQFRPDQTGDGIGFVVYKVTNPSPGVWHYEYAVYNMNLDRAIQSFSVPTGSGVVLSNIGFHAPPQHPGWAADGTVGDAGFSSTPWAQTNNGSSMSWNTETFAQNPNANAIRWGTLYNFRFDSNRPPETKMATVGFFKTGQPITVQVQGPSAAPATSANVSGRVMTAGGNGVAYARVIMTDSSNNVRMTTTNPFGYYRFNNVTTGALYTFTVQSKLYTFTPQQVTVNDNITDLNFTAQP